MEQSLTRIVTANGSPWVPNGQQLQRLLALSNYSYEDASHVSQSGANWWTYLRSADQDILPERKTLISRSRSLTRNNPIGRGTRKLYAENVVGEGLLPRPQLDAEILGLTPDEKRLAERVLLAEFCLFADDVHCDIERQNNFYALQGLAYGEHFDAGDCLMVLPWLERPGNPFGTKIQIVESEQVDSDDFDFPRDTPGNRTVAGVRKDQYGAPVAYQYREADASEFAPRKEVQAFGSTTGRRISWLMKSPDRVRQTRGVPKLASIMATVHDLGILQKAELMVSIVNGMMTGFVINPPGAPDPFRAGMRAEGLITGGAQQQDISMGYGTMVRLLPGQDVKLASAQHPNANFAPYFNAQMGICAQGMGIPVEVMQREFKQSYSASRAAILTAWHSFFIERSLMVAAHFCQPIYEAVIWESVLRGRLKLRGFFEDFRMHRAWLTCLWRGTPKISIDPLKEVLAAKERIGLRISNREKEVAELSGEDAQDIYEQWLIEEQHAAADGVLAMAGDPGASVDPAKLLKDETTKESVTSE